MMATPIDSSISISFLFSAFLFLLVCSLNKGYASSAESTLENHFHTVQINSLLPASVCSPSTKDHSKGASLKVVHKHGPCSHLSKEKANAATATQILTRDKTRVNSIQSRLNFNLVQKNTLKNTKAKDPKESRDSIGGAITSSPSDLEPPKRTSPSFLTPVAILPGLNASHAPGTATANKIQPSTLHYQKHTRTSPVTPHSAQHSAPPPVPRPVVQPPPVSTASSTAIPPTPSNNRGLFGASAGLIGLGRDSLSIVSQTASKYGKFFSYCLPSRSSSDGYLAFGKGGTSGALQFTPLSSNSQNPSFYFIDITGIKVGGTTLSISQSVFKTAGAIIDSGTVITRLPPAAYTPLRTAFRQQMKQYPMAQALSILDTCYDLSKYSTVSIPKISFLFGGNIEVPLAANGILYAGSASQVCLAFAGNSAASDVGIFGNVQQQTLNVVYDVAGGKLGFASGGCS
ncbi:Aspartyl protease family protein [Camellia lanceoleosa]|uniref:Aspartyl protease family protein n=1 Tax=Camellia lanceoleosa TaxID=1840588 RepID=A0ACC0FF61_9ERIC|nr:Aspartyl protease family protein [Camellia lanceoleosa]